MTEPTPTQQHSPVIGARPRFFLIESPFLHAPEGARSIFGVLFLAACGPLLAGMALFGWRAAVVAALCVVSCVAIERLFFRVSRTPAMLGRSHAWLTGLLLALTLPAGVPWFVPVVASAFAIILGKAIFGGVGHFLWQPALVGRLAATVMFPALLAGASGGLLASDQLFRGDVREVAPVESYGQWRQAEAPAGAQGFRLPAPSQALRRLYDERTPHYSAIAFVPAQVDRAAGPLLADLPPINDMLYGARPGGIGETSAILIIVSGLYLVYRNYIKIQLPLAFLLAAAAVAAVAPVTLAGHEAHAVTVWYPLVAETLPVGLLLIAYHLTSGGMLLAAFLLATEMTSRPVTTGGQVIFGLGCGAAAMLLRIYTAIPIPAYIAVLAMNTLTPTIDALWRPRVLGQRWYDRFRRRRT